MLEKYLITFIIFLKTSQFICNEDSLILKEQGLGFRSLDCSLDSSGFIDLINSEDNEGKKALDDVLKRWSNHTQYHGEEKSQEKEFNQQVF